ncbi:MAG TPA: YciI family protein [Gemmatimonadaceae bacterium]|nr:YciI family protein [Gemmatimonadaceae bacterium]
MKFVVLGEGSGAGMDRIMAVYPRHKALVDQYIARGEVVGIGPFDGGGNMAIFHTKEAAERFASEDPFQLEGLVRAYTVRQWNDALIP